MPRKKPSTKLEDPSREAARVIAPRLHGVRVGTKFFGGQSTNPDLVPFNDSNSGFTRMGGTRTILRETPAYWIDDMDGWWRKSDGLGIPAGPTRIHLVPLATGDDHAS